MKYTAPTQVVGKAGGGQGRWRLYLVVWYDIVENRRRARVLRKQREYLAHVQKSVFEGPLEQQRLEPLRRILLEEIDPVTDTIRIFHRCNRCIPATEVFGTGTFLDAEETDEVV